MDGNRFECHARARLFRAGHCLGAQDVRGDLAAHWPASVLDIVQPLVDGCDMGVPGGRATSAPMLQTQTGGTSGAPKTVTRSQASWIASFRVNSGLFDLGPGGVAAVLGDLSHSLSHYALLEGLHLGMDVHLLASLRPDRQLAALRAARVTSLYATPSQLRLLTTLPNASLLTTVRHILCGGGLLDAATRRRVAALCPDAEIRVFYGAAETSFIALADAGTPFGSVGRPYPQVEIQILDRHGNSTRKEGEIWVRSPYLAATVNGRPVPTRDGFVTVGEMGRLDTTGALWLAGRRDRMVKVADQIVHPENTEAVIAPFARCAVLPVADGPRGQVLVAVVEASGDPTLADRIMTACRSALKPAARPRNVRVHPDFPQLPSGKPDLVSLATWLKQTG